MQLVYGTYYDVVDVFADAQFFLNISFEQNLMNMLTF